MQFTSFLRNWAPFIFPVSTVISIPITLSLFAGSSFCSVDARGRRTGARALPPFLAPSSPHLRPSTQHNGSPASRLDDATGTERSRYGQAYTITARLESTKPGEQFAFVKILFISIANCVMKFHALQKRTDIPTSITACLESTKGEKLAPVKKS